MADDEDDAPPAVPEWEPSELAKRIASGHAHLDHFPDLDSAGLARLIQDALDRGERKEFEGRTIYWDEAAAIVVIINPRAEDGGTAMPSDRRYFERWGERYSEGYR